MTTLASLEGSNWAGKAELWLDPLGNDVIQSECTLAVNARGVSYTWSHEGKEHRGSVTLGSDGAEFVDTWHQPEAMACRSVPDAAGLFQVVGSYGQGADWGWRTALCFRAPTQELVLQMTNIAPWGEEARAVRMICTRQ